MSKVQPPGYLPRVVDAEVEECLRVYGAVEIAGTKWCGKTWTARHHGKSIIYLDESSNLNLAQAAPESILPGENPRVIDEWQLAPTIWDTVRHAVDDTGSRKGLWILTGSTTPAYSQTRHSGAGRFGRVRMSPMSLFESGDSTGVVSLQKLFAGQFTPTAAAVDLERLISWCCRGGWPGTLELQTSDSLRIAADYVEMHLMNSIPTLGKNPETARRLLRSTARNLGQAVTYKTLRTDMYGAQSDPTQYLSEATVGEYLDTLTSLYLLEPIPGWAPPARSPKRFRTKERHYLADPSLAVVILELDQQSLTRDFQTLGLVFENLCVRDLLVYARALPGSRLAPLRYYRDDANLEVDVIVESYGGAWGALEIKVGDNKVDQAASNLLRLEKKLLENPAARATPPAFLAVLVGLGQHAYRRPDGVYVIPIATLGP